MDNIEVITLADKNLRKRIQNRAAQRSYRDRTKQRILELEAEVKRYRQQAECQNRHLGTASHSPDQSTGRQAVNTHTASTIEVYNIMSIEDPEGLHNEASAKSASKAMVQRNSTTISANMMPGMGEEAPDMAKLIYGNADRSNGGHVHRANMLHSGHEIGHISAFDSQVSSPSKPHSQPGRLSQTSIPTHGHAYTSLHIAGAHDVGENPQLLSPETLLETVIKSPSPMPDIDAGVASPRPVPPHPPKSASTELGTKRHILQSTFANTQGSNVESQYVDENAGIARSLWSNDRWPDIPEGSYDCAEVLIGQPPTVNAPGQSTDEFRFAARRPWTVEPQALQYTSDCETQSCQKDNKIIYQQNLQIDIASPPSTSDASILTDSYADSRCLHGGSAEIGFKRSGMTSSNTDDLQKVSILLQEVLDSYHTCGSNGEWETGNGRLQQDGTNDDRDNGEGKHQIRNQSLEDRFEFIRLCLAVAGFSSIDAMVGKYYTAGFCQDSSAARQQRISRHTQAPKLISKLRKSSKTWSQWESHRYQSEIIKSAANIIRDEQNSHAATPNLLTDVISELERLPTQAGAGVVERRSISPTSLNTLIKLLQNSMPRIWYLVEELSHSDHTTNQRQRSHTLAVVLLLCYPSMNAESRITTLINNCLNIA